jgi:hypothetical protein
MFASTTIRSALTLSMLSALLVTLSGQPSPAQLSRAFTPAGSPGQANVLVGEAATVLSSMHYQARLFLTCNGTTCSGEFPAIAAKRRLNLTRMTCALVGTAGSTFSAGVAKLTSALSNELLPEFLPSVFSDSGGRHTLNEALDLRANATQHVAVDLFLASGTANSSVCTATGTLDKLQ